MGKYPCGPAVFVAERKWNVPPQLQLNDRRVQFCQRLWHCNAHLIEDRPVIIQRLRVAFNRQSVDMIIERPQVQILELILQAVLFCEIRQIH
ncbi:hypothetical protein D3C74_434800 [compost metagenome]